jgi:ABC-2 type transport system permease protein
MSGSLPGSRAGSRAAGVATILGPKWRSARARLRRQGTGWGSRLLLAVVGLAFWTAIFRVFYRVLLYTRTAEELGLYLPAKILSMVLLGFGSILLLSNLITALSTFFLAKDLDLLMAAPLDWRRFYFAKLGETTIHSSWMVAILAVPIFTAYGTVYGGGPLFPLVALGAFVPFLLIPAVIGSAATLLLVNIFPARRARDLLGLIAIGAAGIVLATLRLMRPEQLARPEGYGDLIAYLSALRTPSSPLLPNEWAAAMVMNWLGRVADPWPIVRLWGAAVALAGAGALLHRALYAQGATKAREGAERVVRRRLRGHVVRAMGGMQPAAREFVLKDLRVFFRDSTQWSQLILLAVLALVYIANIRMLPLFSGERVPFFLVTLIAFLNLGLAGFVLAAVAARFIFPAVSLEGRTLWLLRSSPLNLRSLLWSKYWTGTLPLLVLALALTATTNALLHVSRFMMALSLASIVLFTLAAAALALGLGAIYPQFDTENAAQIPTSFGGLVFMMASVTLLAVMIGIEAQPVLTYVRARDPGTTLHLRELAAALGAVAALCLGTAAAAFRLGLRTLEHME